MNENLMTAYEAVPNLKLCNLDTYNFRLQILLKSSVENEKHEISILIGIFCIGQLASRIAVFYDLRSFLLHKVIIHKSCGEVSLVEQDTIEYVS